MAKKKITIDVTRKHINQAHFAKHAVQLAIEDHLKFMVYATVGEKRIKFRSGLGKGALRYRIYLHTPVKVRQFLEDYYMWDEVQDKAKPFSFKLAIPEFLMYSDEELDY